ncbi:MAG: UvrD-helicase domain-containing protein [Candidatus Latescibacteria bacterium]|nr:UvrD-helicase domain-containing protein [Candidatus Latescibacterota bacterium]
MRFHADLHLHSHFSRATSKNLNLEHLSKWAQLKGIRVVGTGDFVHPEWMDELKRKLIPAEEGLFKLKPEFDKETRQQIPGPCSSPVRFMLTVEISNIYKRHDKVRKVHNIVFAPSFEAAEKIQARLDTIGNIRADGRPILGLDSRDLLEITLESDPLSYLIPAHIWTPWFSALGSKGGFDRIEDCFGDLTSHIFAVETGLSSDPPMNWRLSQLDPYVLVSNSDAHSPPKLGRETTLYDTECTYPDIYRALSDPKDMGLAGTVEFFPEEGKYHYDGHRKCQTRLHPRETITHNGLCPVCGKSVTVGVMARVEELADRPDGARSPRWRPYRSVIPLPEIIGEALQVGPGSKKVAIQYDRLLSKLGNEIQILMDVPLEDIQSACGDVIAEGVDRMRQGMVHIAPGYDGEFGKVRIFDEGERDTIQAQTSLFQTRSTVPTKTVEAGQDPLQPENEIPDPTKEPDSETIAVDQTTTTSSAGPLTSTESIYPPALSDSDAAVPDITSLADGLNATQIQAVTYLGGHLLIVAGPGTGKTHTLVQRVAYLAKAAGAPDKILALTFTNKAAEEMKDRLALILPDEAKEVRVGTFHSICLDFLREWAKEREVSVSFSLATPEDLDHIIRTVWPDDTLSQRHNRLDRISKWKGHGYTEELPEEVLQYNRLLRKYNLLDFDDIIFETLKLIRASETFRHTIHQSYRHLFVDEYQDINAAQHALLKQLVQYGVRITAIGDPNQAIYGFRGADSRFFGSFSDDFPGARTLYLAENYRSVASIIDASSQVIAESETADTSEVPQLTPTLYGAGRITVHDSATEPAEAEWVVHQIEQLVGGTSMFSQDSGRVEREAVAEHSFGDFAVLYRINSLHTPLEEAFQRSGIPYHISGNKPLIQQPAVIELVTMFRLALGLTATTGAVMRLLHTLVPGVGDKTKLMIEANWRPQPQVSLEHVRSLMEVDRLLSTISREGLRSLLQNLRTITAHLRVSDIGAAVTHVPALGIWETLIAASPGAEDSLKKLTRCARLEQNATAYLDNILLSRAYDDFGDAGERVSLMTLHAAKGLEFPVVFIVACEHDLLPLQYPGMVADMEEERRLFYVGMTRAKERLFLVRARRRMLFGSAHQTYPSPFIADIEAHLKHYEVGKPAREAKTKAEPPSQMNLFQE